jgi:hypothetical protein
VKRANVTIYLPYLEWSLRFRIWDDLHKKSPLKTTQGYNTYLTSKPWGFYGSEGSYCDLVAYLQGEKWLHRNRQAPKRHLKRTEDHEGNYYKAFREKSVGSQVTRLTEGCLRSTRSTTNTDRRYRCQCACLELGIPQPVLALVILPCS